jgi:hypothetical protein
VSDIADYESRWNDTVSAKHPVLTVCVYDIARFGEAIVMDMLRTHPFAWSAAFCTKTRSTRRQRSFNASCASARPPTSA